MKPPAPLLVHFLHTNVSDQAEYRLYFQGKKIFYANNELRNHRGDSGIDRANG